MTHFKLNDVEGHINDTKLKRINTSIAILIYNELDYDEFVH